MLGTLTSVPLAAQDSGGNFLVSPAVGLMIWTLIAFGVALWVLGKYAFPRIQEALDKRQKAIEDAIADSEQARAEADKLLGGVPRAAARGPRAGGGDRRPRAQGGRGARARVAAGRARAA